MTNRKRVTAIREGALKDCLETVKTAMPDANEYVYACGILEGHLSLAFDEIDRLNARIANLMVPVKTGLSDAAREREISWFQSRIADIAEKCDFPHVAAQAAHVAAQAGHVAAQFRELLKLDEHIEVALNESQDLFDDALRLYIEEHGYCPACEETSAGSRCKYCGRPTEPDDSGLPRSERDK